MQLSRIISKLDLGFINNQNKQTILQTKKALRKGTAVVVHGSKSLLGMFIVHIGVSFQVLTPLAPKKGDNR